MGSTQGGLGINARTAMQLPAYLMANKSLHRLVVLLVAMYRGQNVTATPAVEALLSFRGMATQGVVAGLTYPQCSRILRKARMDGVPIDL
jgi:hypothetical protein